MGEWREIQIKSKLLQNVAESALGILTASIENCYVTDTGGLARFPRLREYVRLSGKARTYLDEWRGDLVAVSGGQVYRINSQGVATNVTGTAVSGTGRCIFAQTENELLMAAGRDIIALAGPETRILSRTAPESTHVGYVGGRVVASEPRSGRFRHTRVGEYDEWDELDVFSAEGNPDNITALLVTEFGELMLAGPKSIEQFDQAPNGARPFFRRWGLGTGILVPYAFLSVNNRLWGLNNEREWVAFSAQLGNISSQDIQNTLEKIDDFTDAWAVAIPINGQRFMLIQAPLATNPYGTKGVTLLYDYVKQRWGSLYGWNSELHRPERWEGWSYKQVGSRKFVGGEGVVYELTTQFDGDMPQQMLWRSGHISRAGNLPMRIERLSMRVERGAAPTGRVAPILSVRVNKNNRGFGQWMRGSLGQTGDKHMTLNFPGVGTCDSIQYEVRITDNGPIEIARFDHEVTDLRK